MKLTKKQEKEIWQVYDAWLHSYLNGDMATYNKYLDKDYRFIGSTDNEEFLNKKDTTNFFEATADQLAGKCDLRKETRIIEKFEGLVFVTHLFDAWFKNENDWAYYGRFRFTNTLKENKEGWRFIYQHFSTTDSKTDEGETIGFDKVSAENLELKEAIKRRTKELEEKNRELEVEAALERVRSRAMAMHKSDELLEAGALLYKELNKLGVKNLTTGYMLFDETAEMGYSYGVNPADGNIRPQAVGMPHTKTKVMKAIVKSWKKREPLLVMTLNEEETIRHQTYIAEHSTNFPLSAKQLLAISPKELKIHAFNFKQGYLLVAGDTLLTVEQQDMVIRFAKVFEMTYQRFLDLKKAEAQAREANIEASLERIRANALAMKESLDLLDIVVLLRTEFIKLGHEAHYFWHMTWLPDKYEKAMTSGDGSKIGFVMELPRKIHAEIPRIAQWEKSKDPIVIYPMEVDAALDYVDKMIGWGDFKNIDPQAPTDDDIRHIGGLTFIMARTTHGEIGYSLPGVVKDPPKEDLKILQRFAGAFDLAHRRFLDLKKAEAQARETQIELALEKVRSRTMAMLHSDELADVATVLFQQVKELGIQQWTCGFNIWEPGDTEFTFYPGGPDGEILPSCKVPLLEHPIFKQFDESKRRGDELFVYEKKGEVQKGHYKYMHGLPGIGDMLQGMLDSGLEFPEYQIDHVANFAYGNMIFITYEPVLEMHDVFKRFAKVFEQTYTRFLDLQKAEAQAREAHIEAALERVRSRSMAMHHTSELQDVIHTVHQQFTQLNIEITGGVFIGINEDIKETLNCWGSGGTADYIQQVHIPYMDIPIYTNIIEGIRKGPGFFTEEFTHDEKIDFFKRLFKIPPYNATTKKHQKEVLSRKGNYTRSCAVSKNSCIFIISHHGHIFSKETNNVLKRFAKVFEQAYTRFLDLQQAEIQAREAQIEASLEKVRGKAMAMHSSNDLSDTTSMVFTELRKLGVNPIRSGVGLFSKESRKVQLYSATSSESGDSLSLVGWVQLEKHPIFEKIYKAWLQQENYFPELQGEQLRTYYQLLLAGLSVPIPDFENNQNQFGHFIPFSIGCLYAWSDDHFSEEQLKIFRRFASIVDLTFRRYLDLVKAEAQAREAQIEVALERVRSQSMAMHKSDELLEVVKVIFEELNNLEIAITPHSATAININIPNSDSLNVYVCGASNQGLVIENFVHPNSNNKITKDLFNSRNQQSEIFVGEYSKKEKDIFYQFLFKETELRDLPYKGKTGILNSESLLMTAVPSKHFIINVMDLGGKCMPEEDTKILKRFAGVFEQSFTRFLDLQKAEVQAKESNIQLALERVRAKTMAMQNSEELKEVVKVIFNQMTHLKINAEHTGIVVDFEPKKDFHFWVADNQDIPAKISVPYLDLDWDKQFTKAKKNGTEFFTTQMNFEEKNSFYKKLLPHIKGLTKKAKDFYLSCPGLSSSTAIQKDVGLYIENFSGTPFSDEDNSILKRFGKAFQQTYTRFLDLQKAEAQTREAQIESALERVRSKSMAMHKSDDLLEVINVVSEQLLQLGIRFHNVSFGINTKEKDYKFWLASPQQSFPVHLEIPNLDHPMPNRVYEAKKNKTTFFADLMTKEENHSWHEHMFKHSDLNAFHKNTKNFVANTQGFARSTVIMENIFLTVGNYALVPYSEEENNIFKRFAKVFEQSYTRFLDLQKAEAQAREAQIETALEKVRSRTMAMQHSDELPDAANNLFLQVQALDIPAWSAGYCIWENEDKKSAWCNMSSEGEIQKGFSLPTIGEGYNFYKPFKNGESFNVAELGGKKLVKHYDYMKTLPIVGEVLDGFEAKGIALPTFQIFHNVYFTHGYLMFITYEAVPDAHHIFKRFGQVFEQTYRRFLDLKLKEEQAVKLEKEKQRLEKTLKDLQATQTQLIQSEKMASLGELTAGIAHEIQNPLNFVNNFSEVSQELIDELKEELALGNMDDVNDILQDVVQNLEKINHHGKRADGIVKGMLQHSRSSTGTKEPTDINVLADEYLRLAYHGLRAKDKSFNATLVTDLDDTIGSINIIPQDIGRVILNLLTNAFYACTERSRSMVNEKKQHDVNGYEPTVTLTTKKNKDAIIIAVKDNGNGIPKKVLDKIFQPFFTTKPTGQGTGLGLSMSYDIITKGHGGELKVDTKDGKGTEFHIILPVKP